MKKDESMGNGNIKSAKSLCSEARDFIQIDISMGYIVKVMFLLPRCRQIKKTQRRTSIDEWC